MLLQQHQQLYYRSCNSRSFQKIVVNFTCRNIVQQLQLQQLQQNQQKIQRRLYCSQLPVFFVKLNKSSSLLFPSLVIQPYQHLFVLAQQQQYRYISSTKTEDPSSLPSSSSSSESTNKVNVPHTNDDDDDDDDDYDDDEVKDDKEQEDDEGDDDDYEERMTNLANSTKTTTPTTAPTTTSSTNYTSRYKRKNKTKKTTTTANDVTSSNNIKSQTNINMDEYTKEVPVRMPDLDTGNSNIVIKWYKQEGDIVQYGDKLCDIQTQDFTFGIEIEDDEIGFVGEIIVPAPSEPISPDEVLCILLHHESSTDSTSASFTE